MKVGDIFVALGFKVDDSDLKDFQTGIDNLTKSLTLNVAAVGASIYAADRFISMGVDQARAIGNFAAETGQSADELQRWMSINRKFGIENETTIGSITNLSKKLFELKRTGQGSQPFAFLNAMPDMNDRLNPFKVIEKLRQSIKTTKLSRSEFTNYLEQIGLDGRMIRAITLTNDELERFGAITTRLSERDIKNLENAGAIIDEFKQKMEVAFANFTANYKDDIVKGVDFLYEMANGAKSLAGDLKQILDDIPSLQTTLVAAGTIIGLAWKPFFTGIALAAGFFASYGEYIKDNSQMQIAKRAEAGQPRFGGEGWIAKLNNFVDATLGTYTSTKPLIGANGQVIEQWHTPQEYVEAFLDDIRASKEAQISKNISSADMNTVTFNNNFNVQTNEDAQSFSRTLSPVLNEQLKQGLVQFNNGTER